MTLAISLLQLVTLCIAMQCTYIELYGQQSDWSDTKDRASKSVVYIHNGRGFGAGFVCSQTGLVITNAHVVDQASPKELTIEGRNGRTYSCQKIKRLRVRSDLDLVVLETSIRDITPLCVSPTTSRVGIKIGVIGHPLGRKWTLSDGTISRIEANHFQTDSKVDPGNSGGPVINEKGEVIAVVEFKDTRAERMAFLIRSDVIVDALAKDALHGICLSDADSPVSDNHTDTETESSTSQLWGYYNDVIELAAKRLQLTIPEDAAIETRVNKISAEFDRRSKELQFYRDSVRTLNRIIQERSRIAYPEHFTIDLMLTPIWSQLRFKSINQQLIGLRSGLGLAYLFGSNPWSYPDRVGVAVAVQAWRAVDGSVSPTGYLYDLNAYLEFAERVRVCAGIGSTDEFQHQSHANYLHSSITWFLSRGSVPLGIAVGITSSNDSKLTIVQAGVTVGYRTNFFRW